jgi:hypothetical protein
MNKGKQRNFKIQKRKQGEKRGHSASKQAFEQLAYIDLLAQVPIGINGAGLAHHREASGKSLRTHGK